MNATQKKNAIADLSKQLAEQYGTPSPSLEKVAKELLKMEKKSAMKRANKGELPFATFAVTNSLKSPRAVLTTEVARYLIERQEAAKSDHAALYEI